MVRLVGVESRRDRDIEEAQWLAKRLLDARSDEGRAVRPRTDSAVDEDVSEQEQLSLREEESPVHNVLSLTETDSPVSVVVDTLFDSTASVDTPSLRHPISPGLPPFFRFEEVWSISTSRTENGRGSDSSVLSTTVGYSLRGRDGQAYNEPLPILPY